MLNHETVTPSEFRLGIEWSKGASAVPVGMNGCAENIVDKVYSRISDEYCGVVTTSSGM